MKPKKTVKKAVDTPQFVIKFTTGDQIYEGKGATVLEALQAVPRPAKIVAKGYVQISDGTKSKNMPMNVERSKRFFYPMAQVFIAKQLSLGLK